MFNSEKMWIETYKKLGALWKHNGDMSRPHALLTSGKHSDFFTNNRRMIADDLLLRKAASDLMEIFLKTETESLRKTEAIVGPQTGATLLAQFLNYQVSINTDNRCYWASPAKNESNGKKSMVFSDKERKLLQSKTVLLCEDVITTGSSVQLASEAVTNAGGKVLPFVLALVNRSGQRVIEGKKIVSLINQPASSWSKEECPLCKEGSEAFRPKDNWSMFMEEAKATS